MQCGIGYPLYLETSGKNSGKYVCSGGCCYSRQDVLRRIQEKSFGRMYKL
jgi:hypothetical protein